MTCLFKGRNVLNFLDIAIWGVCIRGFANASVLDL